jgi:Type II secretion system (T2SS), protein M subtype b
MAAPALTLGRRVFQEKRSLILPLIVGVLVNVGLYALVVYPLSVKSAGAADRAANAAKSLRAAEQDFASARALVTGKSRAEQELTTFYGKVLPSDQMAAVRLTYVPLPTIARKANVRVVARRWTPDPPGKDARLGRLHIVAALQGDYESLRQFIYELETAPEFVIIDDVTLLQAEVGKPLTLTLELSTYYPLGAHGN